MDIDMVQTQTLVVHKTRTPSLGCKIHASRLIALTQSTDITACANGPIVTMCRTSKEITPRRWLVHGAGEQQGANGVKAFAIIKLADAL